VFQTNEFYTQYDTLKTLHLFFTLLAGLTLFFALISLFAAYSQTEHSSINPSTVSAFQLLLPVALLLAKYFGLGQRVQALQLLGSFVTLLGLAVTAMALVRENATREEDMTRFFFAGPFPLILKSFLATGFLTACYLLMRFLNRERISFVKSIVVVLFFEGFISFIACVSLLALGLLAIPDVHGGSSYDVSLLLIGGFIAAFGFTSLSYVLDHHRKGLALLCLAPLLHFGAEALFLRPESGSYSQLVGTVMMTMGSLMIAAV